MLTTDQIKSGKILIIDDNPTNILLLEEMLKQEGYSSIRHCTDSRKAVPLYEEFRPHLVLLDLNMPHADGFDVMRQLKQIEKESYLSILVLTAQQDQESRLRALQCGARDFLSKPFDLIEVSLRIRNLLEIRLLNEQILKNNRMLEETVQERTHDLSASNEQLQQEVQQRKGAEKQLHLYAKTLERKNQELNDFIKIASHDLQEPLRKVGTFSDLLEIKLPNISAEEKDILDRLRKSALRPKSLLDDLALFSSINSDDCSYTTVKLAEIVHRVVEDLEEPLEKTRGTVAIGELPELEAVPKYMHTLFQHLIANALEFHKDETPPRIKIDSRRLENNRWEISVRDNGMGIEEKHLERIFRPFERLDSQGYNGGTGMGLTLCRKIAERHAGTLTAQNDSSGGTVFLLTLPENQNPA
ncbi:MAG: response regulator [Nitrospinae bacterium]|nr:response regulator [Nitrospinota bacterium]